MSYHIILQIVEALALLGAILGSLNGVEHQRLHEQQRRRATRTGDAQ